jgi:hypothetical protein
MEFTLDIPFIRDILEREYALARDEIRDLGVLRAFENSGQRHHVRSPRPRMSGWHLAGGPLLESGVCTAAPSLTRLAQRSASLNRPKRAMALRWIVKRISDSAIEITTQEVLPPGQHVLAVSVTAATGTYDFGVQ